ncbi:alcohol oxidase [Hypoxylon trugodes]|uniref:alcohol oxidase n=1 Tax=Hypoxylon trugodes TaxID=326681 RepID=UPI00218FFE45|nr:alcohol oxidase [Hypoxylon trugodes]KAI1386225.1 alcohol oxidase [Hypoxylon trugodes]
MGLYNELPSSIESVDVIVAGGGTAGCIVASRLAEADPNLSILVVESGIDGAGLPIVDYPALLLGNLAPGSPTMTFYEGKESGNRKRPIVIPAANVLGGGSAVNMMMYSRAQRSDWDSWKTPGWSADELLPLIKKLETYHGPGSMDVHGSSGPIHVSTGTYCGTRSQNDFISAMNKVGWPEIEDLGSLDACNGVQRAVRFMSPDGKRQDTASRYLRPLLQDGHHPNLYVVVKSRVVRVLFEGEKASGVVYRSEGGTDRTIKATKTVVISCGAFGTPAILERSGVGDPEVLGRAGVSVIANVPGVGRGYEDHQLMMYAYKSSLTPEDTIDGVLFGRMGVAELIKTNHKMLGWNAQDVTCKIRPTAKDIAVLSPEFQEVWNEEFRDNPNKPLMMMSLVNGYPGDPIGIPPGQYYGISTFTVYPHARGHVHITGPDLNDPIDFEAGFFSDEKGIDLKMHRWVYKKQREAARRMNVFRGELPGHHPPFSAESKAALIDSEMDGPLTDEKDIEYSAEDDAIIDEWARDKVGTCWHSLGTCKMAPIDQYGVVDQNLNVHGFRNLKVADLSIVPKNVAANTNHTALVIGEKAADIIIEELGLYNK